MAKNGLKIKAKFIIKNKIHNMKKIEFIKEDFEDAEYTSNEDCPLARAAKRFFEAEIVYVRTFDVKVNGDYFDIKQTFLNEIKILNFYGYESGFYSEQSNTISHAIANNTFQSAYVILN